MSDKEEEKEKAIEYFSNELRNIPIKYGVYRFTLMLSFKKAIDIATKSLKDEVEELKKEAYMKLKDLEKMRKLIEKNKSLKKKIEELEK